MNNNEKLKTLNTAVDNMIRAKLKTEYYEEMLRDIEDGETVGIKIECKWRSFTMDRIESEPVYRRVLEIVKIRLEISKAQYAETENKLDKAWKETRGEA